MIYQDYSGIPKRTYPLNGIPLFGIPGGASVAPPPPPIFYGRGGGAGMQDGKARHDREIRKDDEEILEMLAMIIPTLH